MNKCLLRRTTSLCGVGALLIGLGVGAPAYANPEGGVVSAGSATISSAGSTLTVDQASDKAIIDWRRFDIASGEHTDFQQPSASSVTLNRVSSADPSQILGNLTANGQVMLVNPNGVVFGKGSTVDVGGLVATTSDISNKDFMAGDYRFDTPGNPDAKIINEGSITAAEAGLVALVAPTVRNDGKIFARLGKVQLAAGDRATIDLYGDGLVSIEASEALTQQLVDNTGTIRAEGGSILLTAADAKALADSVIKVSGDLIATTVKQQDGSIVLSGQGADVLVEDGAHIDAHGLGKGGTIKIGGDYLGTSDTPRAARTAIAHSANIDASATVKGDGGRVIVWSDKQTVFGSGVPTPTRKPTINVSAGAKGGDGGFVETSSKQLLTSTALVDASAPNGQAGQWLLDPNNITISTGADGADTNILETAGPPDIFASNADNAIVTTGSIEAALNAGTDVTVQTSAGGAQDGNITVSNNISKTSGGDATLTLKAHENIYANGADITSSTGKLHLIFHVDSDNSGEGAIRMQGGVTLDTNNGNLTMGGDWILPLIHQQVAQRMMTAYS